MFKESPSRWMQGWKPTSDYTGGSGSAKVHCGYGLSPLALCGCTKNGPPIGCVSAQVSVQKTDANLGYRASLRLRTFPLKPKDGLSGNPPTLTG